MQFRRDWIKNRIFMILCSWLSKVDWCEKDKLCKGTQMAHQNPLSNMVTAVINNVPSS